MAPKKRAHSTQEDKLKASKALRYEWRMLNECAARIPLHEDKDKVVYNALIEAFCVHLRNFIEFFHRKPKRGKRPFCADYLLSNETIPLKHKLDKYWTKVNDLLSHLNYKRLDYTRVMKEWPINQIAKEVNENMFQFIEAADKSWLCNDIKAYREQLRSGEAAQDNTLLCTTSDVISSGTMFSAHCRPTTFRRTKKK